MPYPKYFISYITMNADADSNPFGHSCVLLSRQTGHDTKIEALDCIGYYGILPASNTNPIIKKLKRKLGLDIDFTGGYGIYRHEDIRYLERGVGLEGKTFEMSQDRFNALTAYLDETITKQDEAISEANVALKAQGVQPIQYKGKTQFLSADIYQAELKHADDTNEPPRLSPFEFRFSYHTHYGIPVPSFREATNCKSQALKLLDKVGVPEVHIKKELGQGHSKGNVPRLSGEQRPIPLHGIGPLQTYFSKRQNKTLFNHDWTRDFHYDKPHKESLWWTIPPQDIMSTESVNGNDTHELRSRYNLPKKHRRRIITLMAALQRIERLLIHSDNTNFDTTGKVVLLMTLRTHIQNDFAYPRLNQDEDYLAKTMADIEGLLNTLQAAVEHDELFELIHPKTYESLQTRLVLSTEDRINFLKYLDFLSPLNRTDTLSSQM